MNLHVVRGGYGGIIREDQPHVSSLHNNRCPNIDAYTALYHKIMFCRNGGIDSRLQHGVSLASDFQGLTSQNACAIGSSERDEAIAFYGGCLLCMHLPDGRIEGDV